VAPFHPLRHDARAFTARAGAAFAVFLTIAVVLLAGGKGQPLDSAEANKGDTGAGETAVTGQIDAPTADAPAPEPVLGAVPPEAPPVDEPPAADPPPEESKVEEPAAAEPPAEEPLAEKPPAEAVALGDHDDDDEGDHGDDEGDRHEGRDHDGWSEDWDRGQDHDEGDEGDDEGNDDGDEDEGDDRGRGDDDWDDDGERGRGGWGRENPGLSGGGKGGLPGDDEADGGDDEPAPSGRPQITLPVGQEAAAAPTAPVEEPRVDDPAPGAGTGTLRDEGARPGEPSSGQDRSARFTTASAQDGGTPAGSGDGAAGGDAAGGDAAGAGAGAPGASGDAGGGDQGEGAGSGGGNEQDQGSSQGDEEGGANPVTRVVRDFVEVVPDSLKAALAALAALSVLLGTGYLLAALRARRLARQRRELLQEVGLLQTALLPPVPDKVGALLTSVAYRPADGPGAGGDFYDVLPLPGGRVGFILGDVSGHGRGALARTAFMRYTLRAYLEAGLEPRVALQVAGRVIDDNLGGDFATVLLAVHDPETGSLTYATAGHPAPIVVGPEPHDPVTAGSSPPIGVGVRTGLRQTTVPLVPGSVAALFTDGLLEARTEHGILGRDRLTEILEEISDDPTARGLIDRVAAETGTRSDDMAAVIVTPAAGVTAGVFRSEQLELSARELDGPIARRFLEACGLPEEDVERTEAQARELAERFGGVVLHVVFGNRLSVEVLPRNVESIEAASRRVSAGTPQ
jgi:hypothetical protein